MMTPEEGAALDEIVDAGYAFKNVSLSISEKWTASADYTDRGQTRGYGFTR